MRVAFLVSQFPIVSETFILDQITGLIDRGCDVQVFADEPASAAAVHPDVDRYRLMGRTHVTPLPGHVLLRPFRALTLAASNAPALRPSHVRSLNFVRYGVRAASLRLFFETLSCASAPPFDVIHCHFGPNGVRGLALRETRALSGKLITSFYGYDVSRYLHSRRGAPYARLFEAGDLMLAISDVMSRKLASFGCPPGKLMVHRLGVRPDLFSRQSPRTLTGPVRLLSIGRMVPKKGFEFGLRAVAALASDVRVEYHIIGDGPLSARITRLIAELGLHSIVTLAGWRARPEIIEALHRADILLAPSITADDGDEEGTPVVIMEALAAGLAVVSTRHAGIPEVVEDGVSGLLAPERDVGALTAALTRLIADADLRSRMGACGRATVAGRHDIDKLNDRLLTIYSGRAGAS